jgi:hypothetical protein
MGSSLRNAIATFVTAEVWLPACIVLGLCAAVLVAGNSIGSYFLLSQGITVDQTRTELAAEIANIRRVIQWNSGGGLPGGRFLESVRRASRGSIIWLRLLNGEGTTIAYSGTVAPSAEPQKFESASRKANFRVVPGTEGPVIIATFSVRFQASGDPALIHAISLTGSASQPAPGEVIEIGYLVHSDGSVLLALQRNLMLNVVAAVTVIAALLGIAQRYRRYARIIEACRF